MQASRARCGIEIFAGLLILFGCGVIFFDPRQALTSGSEISMMKIGNPVRQPVQPWRAGLFCQRTSNFVNGMIKAGMMTYTRENGEVMPSTVLLTQGDWCTSRIPHPEHPGYDLIEMGTIETGPTRVTKPMLYHLRKAGAPPLKKLFGATIKSDFKLNPGDKVNPFDYIKPGDKVTVTARSIGKGFQGGIKRWNFNRGMMTHGSKSHRAPGSIGMRMSGGGGRVIPGKKMPGRQGNKMTFIPNVVVEAVEPDVNAILVRGGVPGKAGNFVKVGSAGPPGATDS